RTRRHPGRADEVDLIRDFAQPLPVIAICELLGVPFTDREAFKARTKVLVVGWVETDQRARAAAEMAEYLQSLLADKRIHPGEDLLSGLVRARDDGDELSER